MVDLDDGDEIRVTFETPFPVDAGDDRRWRRLNHLFWSGINIKSKTWSVPMPLDCRALTATRSMSALTHIADSKSDISRGPRSATSCLGK
jgi:hypothetical protein